jgi:hypothetical protein
MSGPAGVVAMNVVTGTHRIDAPITLNNDLTINAMSSGAGLTVSNLQPSTGAITKLGPGSFAANNIRASALTINAGTVSILTNGGDSGVGRVGSLSIASSASLDLNDNDLIVTNAATGTISNLIAQARHSGAWDQPGITSSAARSQANHATTLGVLSGAEYVAVNGSTFGSFSVASGDVLVKYTWYGDTDLNGKVNFDDYVRIDNGFNSHLTGWFNGDFDYSGAVNFDDYVLIDLAFNTQSGTLGRALAYVDGSDRSLHGMSEPALERVVQHFGQFGDDYASHVLAAVPEPSTLTLAVVPALAGMLRVRPGRRRREVLGATFHGGATVATATSSAPPTPALHRPSACSTARTCR